jgi:hypothetical protein
MILLSENVSQWDLYMWHMRIFGSSVWQQEGSLFLGSILLAEDTSNTLKHYYINYIHHTVYKIIL